MTKKLNLLLMAVLFFAAGFVLSACGTVTLSSISIKTDSISTTLEVGEAPDFSGLTVYATYSNGDKETITISDLTLSSVDYETAGYQTLTVTYEGKTASIQLTFYNNIEDTYSIVGFEQPEFVTNYLSNISTKTDKTTEFVNRTDGYYVGDDNPFKFLPEITALTTSLQPVTLNSYVSTSVVSIYDNNAWVALSEDTAPLLENYVAIDNDNSTFDFTTEAIGHQFKITVSPFFFPEIDPVSFEFSVVDGWNAYTAVDLSRLDNASIYNGVNPWADYKQANGVDSTAISGLIMHNDIAITSNDIPAAFMYNATEVANLDLPTSVIGTLKDWVAIYARLNESGETFNFIGNYFTLNAAGIPLVKYDDNEDMVIDSENGTAVHSTLFGFGGDDRNVPNDYWIGNAVVKNMNLIGNANRSNDQTYSGGLTFFRVSADNFELDNTISRQVLTLMCPFGLWELNESTSQYELTNTTLIKDSKGYDSFSIMFYLWGGHIDFVNSEFKNAGGPILIAADFENSNNAVNYSSFTATNTVFETYVAGTEAWFSYNGATTIAGQIAAILNALNQKAIAQQSEYRVINAESGNNLFNFIGIIMADELNSSYTIHGFASINEDENNSVIADLQSQTLAYLYSQNSGLLAAPIFITSAGTMFYFSGTDFIDLTTGQSTTTSVFAGDYLYMYYGGMALILQFAAVAD